MRKERVIERLWRGAGKSIPSTRQARVLLLHFLVPCISFVRSRLFFVQAYDAAELDGHYLRRDDDAANRQRTKHHTARNHIVIGLAAAVVAAVVDLRPKLRI